MLFHEPRRRLWTTAATAVTTATNSETSPLEIDMSSPHHSPNYFTFVAEEQRRTIHTANMPLFCTALSWMLQCITIGIRFITNCLSSKESVLLSILSASLFAYLQLSSKGKSDNTNISSSTNYHEQWNWDFYHYTPPKSSSTKHTTLENYNNNKTLLIVQLATESTQSWMQHSCRPNKAYAKQWEADYVQVIGESITTSTVTSAIYTKQQQYQQQQQFLMDQSKPTTLYSFILILPPDAIMTDLDFDVRTLLTSTKIPHPVVVAMIAPTMRHNANSITLWNMNHDLFYKTLQLWTERPQPPATDVVQILKMTNDGFIKPKVIKVPSLMDAVVDIPTVLQSTADSVCYRYYPKCELL